MSYGSLRANAALGGVLTVQGNLIVNNNSSIRELNITIEGTSTIDATLHFELSTTGTKVFKGLVTINGVWSNDISDDIEFQGGLTNNGTFTSGTGTNSFTTNSQNISGTNPVTFNGLLIIDPGTGHTVTLQQAITASNALTISSGTLASEYQITGNAANVFSMAANTTLSLGSTTNGTDIKFPTAFTKAHILLASGSVVIYQNNASQTVSDVPTYANLTIATGGTKTLLGNTTVNGNLAIQGSSTLYTNIFTIIGNATGQMSMASGTTLQLGNTTIATTVPFPTNFTSGNISLSSNSTIIYQAKKDQTISEIPTYQNLILATSGNKVTFGHSILTETLP